MRKVVGIMVVAGLLVGLGAVSAWVSPVASAAMQQQKPKDNGATVVYVTRTGAKYHRATCSSLRRSSIRTTLREATGRYGACKNCRPPVFQVYR